MLKNLTPQKSAAIIALVLLGIIVGAWVFEFAGYPPCELCLMQRWAYYVGVPFAALLAFLKPSWIRPGFILLGLMLAANAVFGVYHSGIEWGWWQGPTTCSGTGTLSTEPGSLLEGLKKPGVMCNEAAIRILGLSLAGWNAIVCGAMALLAFRAAKN